MPTRCIDPCVRSIRRQTLADSRDPSADPIPTESRRGREEGLLTEDHLRTPALDENASDEEKATAQAKADAEADAAADAHAREHAHEPHANGLGSAVAAPAIEHEPGAHVPGAHVSDAHGSGAHESGAHGDEDDT